MLKTNKIELDHNLPIIPLTMSQRETTLRVLHALTKFILTTTYNIATVTIITIPQMRKLQPREIELSQGPTS